MKAVKIYHEPELHNPSLVAAWPGVGNVALIAATHLKDKLEAEEFAEIEPEGFFDPGGIFIKDNLIENPSLPENKFYFWISNNQDKDLIIFLSDAQPAFGAYSYSNAVLDVANRFGVKRVYTLAAALTEHHSETPRVLGAATSPELLDELKRHDIVLANDFYIAGLNGLLLGTAKERGFEGICLLGETARYTAKIMNPRSSKVVLSALSRILDIEIDLAELEELAAGTDRQIKEIGDQLRKEYLQRFTKPIWEREEDTENG